jgi:FkbM family methyltransferase
MVLDIGAYVGEWAKMAREVWNESKIFMVEANSNVKKELENALWADGFEIALLGDKKRKYVPYFAQAGGMGTGNSIFREQTYIFDDAKVRHLSMTTLDEVIEKRKIRNIDLIKIDTQGSELNIIKGGEKAVLGAEFILLETQNLEYNKGAPDIFEVMNEMKSLGFMLFDILEIHCLTTGVMFQIDLLFAKENSKFVRKGKL